MSNPTSSKGLLLPFTILPGVSRPGGLTTVCPPQRSLGGLSKPYLGCASRLIQTFQSPPIVLAMETPFLSVPVESQGGLLFCTPAPGASSTLAGCHFHLPRAARCLGASALAAPSLPSFRPLCSCGFLTSALTLRESALHPGQVPLPRSLLVHPFSLRVEGSHLRCLMA